MSTITDAVEKKKREEEEKKSKTVDLTKRPKVEIPRDRKKIRRRILLILVMLVIGCAAVGGYFYRIQIRDYLASVIPHFTKDDGRKPQLNEKIPESETGGDTGSHVETGAENVFTGGDTVVEDPVVEEETFPELTIGGIYHDPLEPEVLINGEWLKTGEIIEGVRIEEILKDSVRIKFKDTERIIRHR